MTGGRDGDLIRRVAALEKEQRELVAIKNMGKGVLWVVFKIGAAGLALVGLGVTIWKTLGNGA